MAFNRRSVVVAIGIGFVLSLAAQTSETFKARLSAMPADAKTRADLAGYGSASAVLTGTKVAISGSFDGLRSPATSASLHISVVSGIRGPAIGDVTISRATSGTITGAIDLTLQQQAALRKGGLYVQIHSEKAPDGVLWGWLLK
jgi:hypothetical protein